MQTQEQIDEMIAAVRNSSAEAALLRRHSDMLMIQLIGDAISHVDRGDAGSARRVLVALLEGFK